MPTNVNLTVGFGSSKTGLTTVGYQLKTTTGTNSGTRITAGIFEIGGGAYGADIAFADNFRGFILWDTGEATPRFAPDPVDLRAVDASGLTLISGGGGDGGKLINP